MKNTTMHTGTLEIIERLPNSIYGNPRYLVRVDGWTCRTKPNASLAYELPSYVGKKIRAQLGTYYGKSTIINAWLAE